MAMPTARRSRAFAAALAATAAACGPDSSGDAAPSPASRAALLDPQSCASCHPQHYLEWSGSMHAYASLDPVFRAMNRRGQEETGGALGDFCVKCHAPLAVTEGLTTDGLNLEELPESAQGVGCYACHNVAAVDADHNNGLVLEGGVELRARIRDPKPNSAHTSAYSELLAGDRPESARMCGACHDVVLPVPPAASPVHLERTFREWQGSVFAPDQAPTPSAVSTCAGCHLPFQGRNEPIALGGPSRQHHSHSMASVDQAFEPFPVTGSPERDAESRELQRAEIERLLDATLRLELCVQARPDDSSVVTLTLDNASAGHHFPSGVAHDRRAWVELIAYRDGAVIYSSGVAESGEPDASDPDLWLIHDQVFDADGAPAHQFWDVASYEARTIPVQVTNDPSDARFYLSHAVRRYPRDTAAAIVGIPDRVTARVRLRAVALDVLDDLVASGHLDPAHRDGVPTLDLLPFRAFAEHPDPALASLARVSLEWGAAVEALPQLDVRDDFIERPPRRCVRMPNRRR